MCVNVCVCECVCVLKTDISTERGFHLSEGFFLGCVADFVAVFRACPCVSVLLRINLQKEEWS